MMRSKKGQGLSLNVIIVAALALIVLVVLVVIFTGRIGEGNKQIGEISSETQQELYKQQLKYGDCHPSVSAEAIFVGSHKVADSLDAKAQAISSYASEISRCKPFSSDKISCESNSGCSWK